MATGKERIDLDPADNQVMEGRDAADPTSPASESPRVSSQSADAAGTADSTPKEPVANVWGMVWKLLLALGSGVLGIFALSLISHQMNVVKVIRSLNPRYILAAFVLIFLEIVSEALRLQSIVSAVGLHISLRTAMRNILVGEFFARVTPFEAGGGEPAQMYMLYRDDSITVADSTMVFAIKAILSGLSQIVVLVLVPIWLIFGGHDLGITSQFRLILYIGVSAYVVTFAALIFGLVRLDQIDGAVRRLAERPVDELNKRGRFWQRLARRVQKFVSDALRARETAIKANRPLLSRALFFSFISWGLVVLTPILLLYGLGITSSIMQIVVATLIYYIAVSYFPTPGASVGAELGAAALFAVFVPNGILGAFVLIWRFFDHYVKMGAGGITALAEFVLRPARRRRERRQTEKDAAAHERTGKP